MNRDEMEAQANADADKIVTNILGGDRGEEELELRKDATFHKTLGSLLAAEGKRLRGEA